MSVDHSADFVKCQNVSQDAFLGGRLSISQPKKGFRAGVDSVFLGASVAVSTKSVLDLGAGVGTAGLVALTFSQAQQALLVESQPEMVELANLNIEQNELSSRCRAVCFDLGQNGPARFEAGLKPDFFTSVIANPPFFDSQAGTLARHATRADARHMPADSLDHWVRVACSAVAPKGEVIFINRIEQLGDLLSAFEARLGDIAILPLSSRAGQAAGRFLIRGIKGSKKPLRLLAPLVLHGDSGNEFLPDIAQVLRGKTSLVW